MSWPITTRMLVRCVALIFTTVVVLACVATVLSGRRPDRTFQLRFQLNDFVVPASETWRLSWKSPYHAGDVCPAYDVRIEEGSVFVGEHGGVQTEAFDGGLGKSGILDFSATNGIAVVWLQPETRFGIANELLQIEVSTFPLAD